MIGHKQDTDSEDESGDLRVGPRLGGLVRGRERLWVCLKMSYEKKKHDKNPRVH